MGRNDWRPVNRYSPHAKKHAPKRQGESEKGDGGSGKSLERTIEDIFKSYRREKGS